MSNDTLGVQKELAPLKPRQKLLPKLVMFWLMGYFFFPSNKLHYQAFIVIFVLGGLWLIFREKINFKLILRSKVLLAAVIFALYFMFSLFWSVGTPIEDRIGEIKSLIYLTVFGFLVFFSIRHSDDFFPQFLKWGGIVAAASLLFSCIMFYVVGEHSFSQRLHGYGRLWSPLWMAALYGAVAIVSITVLSFQSERLAKTNKLWLLLIFILALFAVIATHSRTAIATTFFVVALAFYSGTFSFKYKLTASALAAFLLMAVALFSLPNFENDLERGQSYRLDLWQGAMELVNEAPFFGYGAGSDTPISSTVSTVDGWHYYHSTYVATLVDLGFIGLALHMMLLMIAFIVAWKARENIIVRVSAFILLFSCLVSLTFGEGIISRMNVQWLLMWLPVLLIAYFEVEKRNVE